MCALRAHINKTNFGKSLSENKKVLTVFSIPNNRTQLLYMLSLLSFRSSHNHITTLTLLKNLYDFATLLIIFLDFSLFGRVHLLTLYSDNNKMQAFHLLVNIYYDYYSLLISMIYH